MILLDPRVGSRECLDSIRRLGVDADIAPTTLDADFQFTGNAEHGTVLIGIERKVITEFLSSMQTRRLAGQQAAPMQQTYDVRYLIIEGWWRLGRENGFVEVPNGGGTWRAARGSFRYAEVQGFIASLEEGGFNVWRALDEHETAAYVVGRFKHWQKEWDEHSLQRTIYAPVPERSRQGRRAVMFYSKPTLLECWLAQLPRIDSRAFDLAKYFTSAGDMAGADTKRWTQIPGVGRKTAEGIVEAIACPSRKA